MKFYRPIIVLGILGIVSLNMALHFEWLTLLHVFLVFVVILIPTGIFTFITRVIPFSFFNPNNFLFKDRKFERGFYEKVGVKKWKSNVPEFGNLVNFKKNKLSDPHNKEYMRKFIDESCRGELVHSFAFFWGFIALLFIPSPYILTAGLPLAIIHAFLHILPVFIQRYIRPRMVRIYERI